jgi:glycosyltransferase involved in cell wall biosynthesis
MDPLIRVLIVGHGPPTTGGIPTFVSRLTDSAWLRERCEDVSFLNTNPGGTKRPGAWSVSNIRQTFVHAWAVFKRGRRADVVHFNLAATPFLPLLRALALCVAAKLAGGSVILHAHTGELERCLVQPSYRLLLRIVLRVVDAFIVVSRSAEAAVRVLGTDNVYRVENGVDVGLFSVGPKQDPARLTYLGTVCERKGLIDLRDALTSLSNESHPAVEVLIVGDGEQEGPGAFERIKKAYSDLQLRVDFLGAIPNSEVRGVLSKTSIFCLPSYTEGFPISILEAMASGIAVIATSVGDVPRMLDDGRAGLLIDPGNVSALRAAIQRLLNDPDERARFGEIARSRAELVFGFENTVRKLFDVYIEAAQRRGSRRSLDEHYPSRN